MKRVFILKGLDCPNCSAKIEKRSSIAGSGILGCEFNAADTDRSVRKVCGCNIGGTGRNDRSQPRAGMLKFTERLNLL